MRLKDVNKFWKKSATSQKRAVFPTCQSGVEDKPTSLDQKEGTRTKGSIDKEPYISNNPYRCLLDRMGGSHGLSTDVREVVNTTAKLPHQLSRSDGNLPQFEEGQPSQRSTCQDCFGQCSGSSLCESRRIQISTDQFSHEVSDLFGSEEEVGPVCSTPKRSLNVIADLLSMDSVS